MTEQPLVLYDFRNPEEAFELMRGGKKGIVTEDFVIKLTALIARLQEQLESDEMALTESQEIIAELKAQINEANELISLLFPLSMNKERALERTTEYMDKWGVK